MTREQYRYLIPSQILALIAGLAAGGIVSILWLGTVVTSSDVGFTPPVQKISLLPNSVPLNILSIDKIGVHAPIETVGLARSGNMKAPSTFHTVAWYDKSAVPGSPGTAVIVGHVDNALGTPAVFYHLKDLVRGDLITITDSNGKISTFTVTKIATYKLDQAPLKDIFLADGTSTELHLITCSGSWIQQKRMYDERLVVYAVKASK